MYRVTLQKCSLLDLFRIHATLLYVYESCQHYFLSGIVTDSDLQLLDQDTQQSENYITIQIIMCVKFGL